MHEHDERNAKHRDYEIGNNACERNDDVAFLEIAVIARIDRHRLRSPEHRRMRYEKQQRQDDRHERVDVLRRVPRKAAELVRRQVAVFHCRIPVSVLVRHHREEQNGGEENELLDRAQSFIGIGVR
jgi:hypothetical protein